MNRLVLILLCFAAFSCERQDIEAALDTTVDAPPMDATADACVPAPEVCDGLDNDCNGSVDDQVTDDEGACRVGQGQCARDGEERCVGGKFECNVLPGEPDNEACDAVDNDCDGETDEVSEPPLCPFDNGSGACQEAACALVECEEGFFDADGVADNGCESDCAGSEDVVETCNDVDDDCDGRIDEDFELTTDVNHCGGCQQRCAPENAVPSCLDGACGILECRDGFVDADGNLENGCELACALPERDELCDGEDNDCDGVIDEALMGPCGINVGECSDGMSTCTDGAWGRCVGAVSPVAEACDGMDNDCDGTVDEAFDLLTSVEHCGACDQACAPGNGTGECVDGACAIGSCDPTHFDLDQDPLTGCEYRCVPFEDFVERCNVRDDDCDGLIDEDFNLDGDAENCGVCGRSCAVANARVGCLNGACSITACVDGFVDANGDPEDGCEAQCAGVVDADELCDGLDDDCDGEVDENFDFDASVFHCGGCDQPCARDNAMTACRAGACTITQCMGPFVDADGAFETGCECLPGNAGEECNGRDDDCDGRTDEVEMRTCGSDVGECITGITQCSEGAWGPCAGEVVAAVEVCNGRDDDCDGREDEDLAGGECETGLVGRCATGRLTCVEAMRQCLAPEGEPEVCDDIDNDCDGRVDESEGGGEACCEAGDGRVPCNDCVDHDLGVPAGWVCIPPGNFRRGSRGGEDGRNDNEGPQGRVDLTRAFVLMATEVTIDQWSAVFAAPQPPRCSGETPGQCPVGNINFWEAIAYANALSERDRLERCYALTECQGEPGEGMACADDVGFAGLDCLGYRLPTEAEWEYATRAGSQTRFWSGNSDDSLDDVGWHAGNALIGELAWGRPVGQLEPNSWGLYDVHGNIAEWVNDWFELYRVGDAVDPTGAVEGTLRIYRGGSWVFPPQELRSAARVRTTPRSAGLIGIRLARTVR
jgi:formylglycine-generating enzyme required for sulfatase activity